MEQTAIHQIFLRAAIQCAEQGARAKDLADYLEQAAKGMRLNAAFDSGMMDLAANLREELES